MYMNSKERKMTFMRAAMTLLVMMLTTMTVWAVGITVHVTGEGTVTYDETHSVRGNGDFTISANCGDNISLTITPDDGSMVKKAKYSWEEQIGPRFYDYSADLTLSGTTGTFTVNENTVGIYVDIVFESVGLAGGTEDEPVAITDNTETVLSGGWYVVSSDITFDHTLTLKGSTVLSLASGATMTINSNGSNGIDASNAPYSLTVCGEGNLIVTGYTAINVGSDYTQTGGNVTLSATRYGIACNTATISGGSLSVTMSEWGITTAQNLTISGGTVDVTSSKCGLRALLNLYITGGSVTAKGDEDWDVYGEAYVNITGGQVTAVTRGINSYLGSIILGCTNATDFITASRYGGTVEIADGQTLYDGTGASYNDQTESSVLTALTDVTLRNYDYRTVTFDIADDDDDPEAQIVTYGETATEPSIDARTGYTVIWKNGEDDYDFNAAVTSNLTLIGTWEVNTYTVQFHSNGGSGTMDAVTATYGQWTDIPTCTFTAPTGYALKEYGWNTAADGIGTAYEAENGRFLDLASERGAVVTLYAQWGKDISTCTAIVPNQLQNGTFYIGYNFEGEDHGGIKVYDGGTLLTYGTDYYYTTTESLDTDKYKDDLCTHVGEHCRVHLKGTGAYAGELTGDFIILSVSGSGTWGNNLAWSYEDGRLSITGDGAMAESENSDYSKYPWYDYYFNITTISIGEGITSVASNAFGGTNNVNPYGGATTVSLPSTLNSIGEGAFAYCTGLTFNVDELKGVTIGLGAFNKVGCIVGSLKDMGDNTEMIEIMNQAISADVTLNGRTLYKDGKWNTICLPFNVDLTDDECPLKAAGVEARTVAVASITGETLNLTFSNPVTTLEAGVPYIIKWENDTENPTIVNPVFNGVTVDAEPHNYDSDAETVLNYATDARVRFLGTYDALSFSTADSNILMMGGNNTLYYPGTGAGLGACRAYFKIGEDSGSQAKIRSFNMNFDEGTESGIIDLKAPVMDERNATDGWYTLSGVRLNGKPTEKGMYIHGGKKVMIK
jgi:hypothetical protein